MTFVWCKARNSGYCHLGQDGRTSRTRKITEITDKIWHNFKINVCKREFYKALCETDGNLAGNRTEVWLYCE